ncbi:MAG: NUDIX domain-containing protein [Candidatus Woesearchaeota archaeon]
MKEEIDIVDAHDEIVGKADRSEAHKKGLLHRVVHVMVFDPDGRLFLQQRALSKDCYPGFWEGSLSGHVKSGETFKEAAERELHEELGVCAAPKRVKEVIKFGLHEAGERVLAELYALKDFKGEMTLDSEEVKFGEFWTMKKLEAEIKVGKKMFHPLFLKALNEFKAMKETAKEYL